MTTGTDAHARAISNGLGTLDELLATPVATSALELSKNAEAAAQYDVLRRLRKSLLQYLERDGNLFYVGMLGHFSAGKSSTINSVLDVWGSETARKVSLNPTDITITLVTKAKNEGSLLGVIREGHVTIRLQTIESPVLDQIVLADTPGTGDPQFIKEVARDFLPICDVLLFVFSATSPLDTTDVPMLIEIHKRLPFIPLHFVITRADELRIDRDKPLTEENLDKQETETFLSALATRINTLLGSQAYLPSSFSLIDNKSHFRVDELRNLLLTRCNLATPQAHTSMHNNKLQYFLEAAKALRSFFSGILDHKLSELSKIVSTAARNIDRYQQNVQLSNNNLTKAWIEYSTRISRSTTSALDTVKTFAMPGQVAYFQSVSTKIREVATESARDARFNATSIAANVRSELNASLQDHLYRVQKTIAETSVENLSAADHGVSSFAVATALRASDVVSQGVILRRCNEIRNTEFEALKTAVGDLRRSLKDVEDALSHRVPLLAFEKTLDLARESLQTDLNQFFQTVELYRSGVFSHATKESIATLGIGRELDELESEFTEEDRTSWTNEALTDFFPGSSQLFSTASVQFQDVVPKIQELGESCKTFLLTRPDDNGSAVNDAYVSRKAVFVQSLETQLQADVDRFCENVNLSVGNALVKGKTRFASQLQEVSAMRVKKYGVAALITAVVCMISIFMYHHFKAPAPSSTYGVIGLSVISSLIAEAIVLSVIKWKENLPEIISNHRDQIRTNISEEVKAIFDSALKAHDFTALNESNIMSAINRLQEQTIEAGLASWKPSAEQIVILLRQLHVQYLAARTTYVNSVESARARILEYFTNESQNIQVLNKVAARIKERAIEPSFALLDRTRQQLVSVQSAVSEVGFD